MEKGKEEEKKKEQTGNHPRKPLCSDCHLVYRNEVTGPNRPRVTSPLAEIRGKGERERRDYCRFPNMLNKEVSGVAVVGQAYDLLKLYYSFFFYVVAVVVAATRLLSAEKYLK